MTDEREREFEGDDLDGALRAASEALRTPPDALEYELVEHGRKGIFGLGSRRVRIRVEPPAEASAVARTEPAAPKRAPDRTEATPPVLEETLRRMLDLAGLELSFEVQLVGEGVRIHLDGPDRQALLRRDGELIAALQLVLNRMGRRAWPEAGFIRLGCEGSRRRSEEEVVELAREVAQQVARTGDAKQLHEMNPYERRLVHLTVKEFPALVSRSVGEGFLKKITVERSGAPGRRADRRSTEPRAQN